MEPKQASLWARSPAWRWLLAAAVFCTALALVGSPWHQPTGGQSAPLAQFDASKVVAPAKPTHSAPVVQRSATTSGPDLSDQTPTGPDSTRSSLAAQSLSGSAVPPTRSQVVWANEGGTISGGGLIAAYCCAGASSTVRANKSVSSGKHYWELVLSVRPGQLHPDTWTAAGVLAASDPTSSRREPRPGASSGSPIRWGQRDNYNNGDVFMFALDAERGQLFLGVNGQWHNGVPGEQGGETIGSPRSNFTPYATMSASSSKTTPEGDRWIANFGGSKFKYPIPGGFAAYGSSAAAQTTSSSASPPQQVALASAQGSSSTLNRVFQDEISIGGQRIPLPEGKWTGLAFFRGGSGVQGDSTLLGRVVDGRLSGVVAINAYVTSGRGDGFPAFAACDRTDYLYANPTSNRAFGQQRCWWINHASQVDTQPIFRAAASVLDQRGVALPATLINVGFRRATTDGFATVFYYFNPEEAGLASQRTTWGASEWHKGMISEDPRRMAYVERLRKWGESWAPVFFAMGRQQ